MTDIWLDRSPQKGDAVQLINSRSGRVYAATRILPDGRVAIKKKGWPGLIVQPDRLRVLNRECAALTPPAEAVGMATEKERK